MVNSRIRVPVSRILAGLCVFSLFLGPNILVVADHDDEGIYGEDEAQHYNGKDGHVTTAGGAGDGRYEICSNTDLNTFLPPPYGNMSGMACTPLWNTFVLRSTIFYLQYIQRQDHVMTIVASALYTSGWVGIGFSKDGRMIGSSAMIGWFTKRGHARIKQFYLQGYQPNQVIPDQGELQLEKVPPVVVLHGAMVYLAFQVRFETRLGRQPIILAFSSKYPTTNGHLSQHDDKTTIMFDFSRGRASILDLDYRQRRNHGILGILGWGLLLPLGAIIARHLKHKDPLWYYLHAVIQFTGFMIGVAGVLVGIELYKKTDASIPTHKGLGIFLLGLSILQVLAFFLRPNKDSKIRKYWNWYHQWLGRIALFFGSFNIILGITLASAGKDWKIGYGFLLTVILVAVIVLEVLLRMRSSYKPPPPPTFQMNPIE